MIEEELQGIYFRVVQELVVKHRKNSAFSLPWSGGELFSECVYGLKLGLWLKQAEEILTVCPTT